MVYDVAIVGGGFSGLCAAVMLTRSKINNIAVFDANKRIGKKILATGNGQGNLTNADMSLAHYHGDASFAADALGRFGKSAMLGFFGDLGLLTSEKDGKIYPANFCASSILDVLRFAIPEDLPVFTETRISDISKEKGNFVLKAADGKEFFAEKVVLAFGGSSGDGFSTDGKSYLLAEKFGHKTTTLAPSLVQLKTEREKIRGLKGIKQSVRATLSDCNRTVKSFAGDLLFTDYGISGNAIFSLSAYLKGLKKPTVKIEFLPDKPLELLEKNLIEKVAKLKKSDRTCERLMISVLPKNLAKNVAESCGITLGDTVDEKSAKSLAVAIKNFDLKVEGTAGFAAAQVTAGGIDCRDVNAESMQSKLCDGLYIVGEALNVDGDCGGYNLQWSFSSAAACTSDLAAKLKNGVAAAKKQAKNKYEKDR